MPIHRITAEWDGFPGAPGYTNFHFFAGGGFINDAQSSADRVYDFFNGFAQFLANGVTVSIQPDVEEIDESTGMVTDFVNIDPPDPVSSPSSSAYSGATGAVVNWRTNDLRNGRRIRGRTFLVPLSSTAYDDEGSLTLESRGTIQNAANGMVGGDLDSELTVWSRPINGSGGVAATVVQASVPDLAAVLRSRRD